MIYRRYGEVFKKIRVQKNLPLSYFSKIGINKGNLSRFESGKAMMNLDRVYEMLQEMNVSLEEYELMINRFVEDTQEEMLAALEKSYLKSDEISLRGLYEEAVACNYQILSLVIKAQLGEISTTEVSEVVQYISNAEIWGYFELSLFYFILDYLDSKVIIELLECFESKNENYCSIFKYRRRILQIAYLSVILLSLRDEESYALHLLTWTRQCYSDDTDFYTSVLREFCSGVYTYCFKSRSLGKREISNALILFEKLGSTSLRNFYKKRIEEILSNN